MRTWIKEGRLRSPWTRCSTGSDGQSSDGPSLSSLATKGLSFKPLSLEEQVALEEQLEEKRQPAAPHTSSVPLSGLVKGRVLSLAEQVEVEQSAGDTGAGIPDKSQRETKLGTDSSTSGSSTSKTPQGTENGEAKNAVGKGLVSLSDVAATGFGGRALSLEEQVELERQAEERGAESSGRESEDRGWEENGFGDLGGGEKDLRRSDGRQAEIEAALGKKLQEVLGEGVSLQQRESSPNDRADLVGKASGESGELENERGVLSKGAAGKVEKGSKAPPLKVSLVLVDSPQAEHALATLRAQVFYTYPDVGKMTAAQKVTARSEFRRKLKENTQEEKGMVRLSKKACHCLHLSRLSP